MATSEVKPEVLNSPVYWFTILQHARNQNDFETAAHAREELKRLGVTVTYRRKTKKGERHE